VRWFRFAILVVLTVIVQMALGRVLGLGFARVMPDLLLMFAVIIAFRGPADTTLIACWFLGLAKDLTSQAPLGAYALSFGLLTLLLLRVREIFYGERALTLMLLSFLSSVLVELAVWLLSALRGETIGGPRGGIVLNIMLSALFTAGLSPYGLWLLTKLHRQLGLPARRRYASK
jgi:rod shape-determining protein MreD